MILKALCGDGGSPKIGRGDAATLLLASDSADGVGVLGGVAAARRRRSCRSGGGIPSFDGVGDGAGVLNGVGAGVAFFVVPPAAALAARRNGAEGDGDGDARAGEGAAVEAFVPFGEGIASFSTSSSSSSPPQAPSSRGRRRLRGDSAARPRSC